MEQLDSCEGGANGSRDQADTEHHDDRATRAANFAPSEITAADAALGTPKTGSADMAESKTDVDAALKASREFDSAAFFSEAHLKPTFIQSYRLLNALIAGGDDAVALAMQQAPLNERKRKISLNKPELIALELTAKPQDKKQRKQCSSHACVLKMARKDRVANEQFPAWLEDPNNGVKKCRERVAKMRPDRSDVSKPFPRREPPTPPDNEAWVKLVVGKGSDISAERSESILPLCAAKICDLIDSATSFGHALEDVAKWLHRVAAGDRFMNSVAAATAPPQPSDPDFEDRVKMANILREPPTERDGPS